MKLYINGLSPNSRKVTAISEHLGSTVDLQVIDLSKGENKTPEFLSINPQWQNSRLARWRI